MVSLTDRALEIDTYLTPTTESTYPWQLHYLVLAVIGGLLYLPASLGVPGFAAIPTLPLGFLLVLSFAVSAAVQYWQHLQRQRSLPAELIEGNDR